MNAAPNAGARTISIPVMDDDAYKRKRLANTRHTSSSSVETAGNMTWTFVGRNTPKSGESGRSPNTHHTA